MADAFQRHLQETGAFFMEGEGRNPANASEAELRRRGLRAEAGRVLAGVTLAALGVVGYHTAENIMQPEHTQQVQIDQQHNTQS